MSIDAELERRLNHLRSKLSFLSGVLMKSSDGLDAAEIGGLSLILMDVLESLETVFRLVLETPGASG